MIAAVIQMTTPQNDAEFDYWDAFWTLYPRREAKKDARQAWRSVPPRDYVAVLVAVAEWRKIWAAQMRDSRMTPLAGTWLRGERWEDEVPHEFTPAAARPMTVLPEMPRKSGEIPAHVLAQIAKLKGR